MSARGAHVAPRQNALAWLLIAVSISGLATVSLAPPAGAADAVDTAAQTQSGTGAFSQIKVTVSQTKHLVNQVVRVSWTGAAPTGSGNFDTNYMQVMQCWGDGPVPLRENCQFGAYTNDARGGSWAASRQVTYGTTFTDPLETIKQPAGSSQNLRVPFTSVKGGSTTAFPNPDFDTNTTNEEPFGRTAADGSGQVFFEMQTAQQAPALGCGDKESDGSVRNCWLVVVPRNNHEVDGTTPPRLDSSPLSQTNWNNAISFRMAFDPLGVSCPIGASEHQMMGEESAVEAMNHWQPALCKAAGSAYTYSQVSDDVARNQTLAPHPRLSFISQPVDSATVTDGRKLLYAPVAVSGVGVAFNIDERPRYGAPPDVVARAGLRISSLKLNARLVAKLLTQSYSAASVSLTFPAGNPEDLTRDKEFLDLNPEFKQLFYSGPDIYEIVVPEGLSDAYREVWQWIASDSDAAAFMNGKPDPNGMVVNPAYQGLDLTGSSFPRADLLCRPEDGIGALCPSDFLAYSSDFHNGGRSAARGDLLARTLWDYSATPPQYKKPPLQLSGSRDILALTDTATAARFSLPMASLGNASGNFIAPTNDSMTVGLNAMAPTSTPGVAAPNPGTSAAGAYPLTHVTYALTSPDHLTQADAGAYSKAISFMAHEGQKPGIGVGQLPLGYVPLPPNMVTLADSAAAALAAVTEPAAPTATDDSPATPTSLAAVAAPVATAPAPAAAPAAAAPGKPVAAAPTAFVTPMDPVGNVRFGLVIAFGFSLAAGLAWLFLPMLAKRGPPAT